MVVEIHIPKTLPTFSFPLESGIFKEITKHMESIQVEDDNNQFLIRIDKSSIEKEALVELLHKIRIEDLSTRADLGEDVEQLGEEIKADWWSKNKARWIEKDA